MSGWQNNKGFTLLEVMVALSMIAIVFVAVFKMLHNTMSMNDAARFHSLAPILARNKMAEIELRPLVELADDAGEFGDEFSGYRWAFSVEQVESTLPAKVGRRLRKIDLTIAQDESERAFRLRLYKFYNNSAE